MSHFFRTIPLPVKLILVGLVPLLFLLYLAFETAREKSAKLEVIDNYYEGINRNILLTDLTSEIHLERRHSLSYMIQKEDATKMVVQRTNVDKALQIVENQNTEGFKAYKEFTLLSDLEATRNKISSREITSSEMMNYYTSLISRIHSVSSLSVDHLPFLEPINKNLTSQNLLTQLNNNLGLLRAEVYSGMVNKGLLKRELEAIVNHAALIKSIHNELLAKSEPEVGNKILSIGKTTEGRFFSNTINQLLTEKRIDPSVNPDLWWGYSTKLVDELLAIQKRLLLNVKTDIQAIHDDETQKRNIAILGIIGIIIIVLAIIVYTIKSISDSLKFIRLAAENISTGATGIELKIYANDAIGSLARSINRIDANNIILSNAADEIGRGRFNTPVKPRSDQDVLGNAVVRMKDNLQKFTKENEERAWIQSGISKVNDSLLGEKTLAELTGESLATLIRYIGLELGLFYVSNNYEFLDYYSGYAVNKEHVEKKIPFGQTLIGQAAVDKEIIYLENIPENYPKITSSIGNTLPNSILITPLVHNGLVEGTIELASLNPISKSARELISQVSNNIATAVQAAKSRAKLQELFEETQAQSEELQAQHTEMENLNTELEVQTQKLQASEEELKVQQEELLQSNKELEQRASLLEEKNQVILERNLEIQKKAEELALSTKYKSEFLANMSHELRTPLNSILLLSRLMSENETLDPEQVEYAKVIQSSGKGLLNLIDEILDLSKIEAGKMDLEYAPVEITSITNDMRSLFEPLAKEKNLLFTININSGTPEVIITDKMRLEQIIKNLISNALKFTHSGSVTLDITPAETDGFLNLIVTDTGIGISKEKQQLIFEAFQQADGSTRRKFGGTGLGLSISRELVKLLGGEISITSESEKGSVFTVTIPTDRAEQQPATSEQIITEIKELKNEIVTEIKETKPSFIVSDIPAEIDDDRKSITTNDKTVLIIEDDTNFATALLSFTHKKGYKGIVAVRGDQGIEMAQQYRPIAILLDIQLPVKDGWQVMEELKSNPKTRHIPVHIMSSLEVKKESLLKGAVDFINKPVAIEQMQQIFAKLEDALNRHPKKVLIVEENPKHAQALSYFLSNFNVTTEIKGSVKDGVEALNKKEVDCVILDMGIPDHTSYETLETVKQTPGLENLPIIIFTGKHISKTEENKIMQYADSIVVKTAHSYQRILDEVALFLHIIEENQLPQRSTPDQKLGSFDAVLKDKTVLIADDDVRNIFSLTKALEQHKMKVVSAIDGKEALTQLKENQNVNIVLMDMMMPELDGYDTIARIRKNPKFKNLPILAVTAKAMMGDREKCISAGASDYISKPVDIDQLISLLRVWLYDK